MGLSVSRKSLISFYSEKNIKFSKYLMTKKMTSRVTFEELGPFLLINAQNHSNYASKKGHKTGINKNVGLKMHSPPSSPTKRKVETLHKDQRGQQQTYSKGSHIGMLCVNLGLVRDPENHSL